MQAQAFILIPLNSILRSLADKPYGGADGGFGGDDAAKGKTNTN